MKRFRLSSCMLVLLPALASLPILPGADDAVWADYWIASSTTWGSRVINSGFLCPGPTDAIRDANHSPVRTVGARNVGCPPRLSTVCYPGDPTEVAFEAGETASYAFAHASSSLTIGGGMVRHAIVAHRSCAITIEVSLKPPIHRFWLWNAKGA